ncbi:MAG: hypothetical protein ABL899_01960 [Nitrospira sp.]
MLKDHSFAIIFILIILTIALFGGGNNSGTWFTSGPQTPEQKQAELERKIQNAKNQVDNLSEKIQDEKERSEYAGLVKISSINRSTDPGQEYITINTTSKAKNILVTGWTIKSLSSGNSIPIPKANYLYFTRSQNTEEDIYLSSNETLYINTGYSPIGLSFRINKCTGYLNQFQTFVPYINNRCPLARNEDLSSIPKRVENDACFDYIDNISQCRIQTTDLPIKWSYECKKFISEKINYASCVDNHKNDLDFNQHEWRVYLKRDAILWKKSRETVVLYDSIGKVVSKIEY